MRAFALLPQIMTRFECTFRRQWSMMKLFARVYAHWSSFPDGVQKPRHFMREAHQICWSTWLCRVCASIALHQVPPNGEKPSVPNGYFGYDGGDVKAGR